MIRTRFGTSRSHISALLGASLLALGAAANAAAQDASARGSLDQITVTAQRRAENQQDVPISITTVPKDRLAEILQATDDIRALAARVPGLYAESSNGRIAPRFYIRGLGNTDFDLAASQPVSVIVDEIVMENVVLKSFPLFDISQVEVLRGPQGSLFGRNTPAGIVKIETVKPGDEPGGFISGSLGRFTTAKVEAAIGGPLLDGQFGYRASLLYQRRSDWIDNGVTGQESIYGGFSDFAGRIQASWTPNEVFEALINFHGRRFEGSSEFFRANILGPGNNELNNNFRRDRLFYDGGAGNNQQYDNYGGSLRASLDVGPAVITSITGLETAEGSSRGDIDGGFGAGPGAIPAPIPFPSDTQDGIDELNQFTQEIRIASDGDGPFRWQAGFFYFDSKLVITTNPFFVPATTVRHDNQSWALFAQASYDFTDRINFTGGVRYTEDDKDFRAIAANFPVAPVSVSDGKVSWDASLFFGLTDDISLYARIARGFRAPTIQGRDVAFFGAPTTATSETVLSYEAGFKSQLFGDRARINATAFYYDANGLQFSAIGGLGNFNQLVNADGRAWGFEVDAEALITENFRIYAGASYNNTEITEPGLRVAPCGGGCTVLDPVNGLGLALIEGNRFPQAPDWIFNVAARYEAPLANGDRLYLSTDWAYQGKTNFFLYESAEFNADGQWEGGARLGWLIDGGRVDVAVFARNILDAENVKGGIDFNNLTGFVNEPRIYGVSATLNF